MSDDFDSVTEALKVKFLGRSKDLATQLSKDLDRLDADGDAAKALIISAHKLSGGGGTFGYPLLSRIAGDMEILLDNGNRDGVRLRRLTDALAGIVEAGGTLEPGAEARLLEDLADALLPPD